MRKVLFAIFGVAATAGSVVIMKLSAQFGKDSFGIMLLVVHVVAFFLALCAIGMGYGVSKKRQEFAELGQTVVSEAAPAKPGGRGFLIGFSIANAALFAALIVLGA